MHDSHTAAFNVMRIHVPKQLLNNTNSPYVMEEEKKVLCDLGAYFWMSIPNNLLWQQIQKWNTQKKKWFIIVVGKISML